MAAPTGNKNAVGHRGGGGRPSAYKELADAKELHEFWRKEWNIKELQEKIRSGNFSGKTMVLFKLLSGNERIMVEVMKKIFPDQSNIQTNAGEIAEFNKSIREILEGRN